MKKKYLYLALTLLIAFSAAYNNKVLKSKNYYISINNVEVDYSNFLGEWEVTELCWYSEGYFSNPEIQKELNSKLGKRVNGYKLKIGIDEYKESDIESEPDYDYDYYIKNPIITFKTYDMNQKSETYNTFSNLDPYLKSLGLQNKPIKIIIIKDPISKIMDSGEIDWYYIPTKVFVFVDKDTLLLTDTSYVELFKCERIKN